MSSDIDVQDPDGFGNARALATGVAHRLLDTAAEIRKTTAQILAEAARVVASRKWDYASAQARLAQAQSALAACTLLSLLTKGVTCEVEKEQVAAATEACEIASELYSRAKRALRQMQARVDTYFRLLAALESSAETLGREGARFLERRQDNVQRILNDPLGAERPSIRARSHGGELSRAHYSDERAAAPELSEALTRWADRQEKPFRRGVPAIFHSADLTAFGEYDSSNNLRLSSRVFSSEGGYRPYNDALAAVDAIREGRPLSFNQEHGLETLWHEVTHARSDLGESFLRHRHSLRNEGPWRTLIETMVEWYSRRTYTLFIKELGGEARYEEKIKEGGYAYQAVTKRLDTLIKRLGLSERRAEIIIETMVLHVSVAEGEDHWEGAAMEFATTLKLAASSRADPETVKDALLRLDSDQFDMLLHSI